MRMAMPHALIGIPFLALYCLILFWLRSVNIYEHHFSDHGGLIIIYQFARTFFALSLAWLLYWTGWAALCRVAGRQAVDRFCAGERVVLGFFTGGALWHIVLL